MIKTDSKTALNRKSMQNIHGGGEKWDAFIRYIKMVIEQNKKRPE